MRFGKIGAVAGDDRLDGVVAGEEPVAALGFGGGDDGLDLRKGFGEGFGGLWGIGAVALEVVAVERGWR